LADIGFEQPLRRRSLGRQHTGGVTSQHFSVTEKVQALYQQQQPPVLPAADEPAPMRKIRAEHHRRMLGNGYCARPVELDCHYETICESCTFSSPPSSSDLPSRPNETTPPAKAKPAARKSTTDSSNGSMTPAPDTDHPHKPTPSSESRWHEAVLPPHCAAGSARRVRRWSCSAGRRRRSPPVRPNHAVSPNARRAMPRSAAGLDRRLARMRLSAVLVHPHCPVAGLLVVLAGCRHSLILLGRSEPPPGPGHLSVQDGSH